MKNLLASLVLSLCCAGAWALDDNEVAAVRATLDAYVDGWYAADGARLEAATHPALVRRKTTLAGSNGAIRLEEVDQLGFITAARNGWGLQAPAEDRRRMATEVFDVRSVSALALVETGGTFSYLQLVRDAGHWQVLNVLWEPKISVDDGREMKDSAAVEAAVRDYAEAWYSGNAKRMEHVLHPALLKRKPTVLDRQGKLRIDAQDAKAIIAASRSGIGRKNPSDQRIKKIDVLDIRGRSAVARLETGQSFDYLALVRDRDRWLIANILWEPLRND